MNDSAAYDAYSQGITTLAQHVCAEFLSTWGKRNMLSVFIVAVRAAQVGIDLSTLCLAFLFAFDVA